MVMAEERSISGGELKLVAGECDRESRERGVARLSSVGVANPEVAMSINNRVSGTALSPSEISPSIIPKAGNRCYKGRISKKHIFGIVLLIIVDLIWVGSAGLTKVGNNVIA